MKARSQSEHERINAREYPGTRQLCVECDEPTGRCEDDSLEVEIENYHWGHICTHWHGPLCPACYDEMNDE